MENIKPVFGQQVLTFQDLSNAMNSMDRTGNPLGCHDCMLVQIEMYSRMICYGLDHPFPHSRQHLVFALIGLKSLLRKISLAELVIGSSEITGTTGKHRRPATLPMEMLDHLLDCPMIADSLPTLKEALRFINSKDQQEIFDILKLKLQGNQEAVRE